MVMNGPSQIILQSPEQLLSLLSKGGSNLCAMNGTKILRNMSKRMNIQHFLKSQLFPR